jgi:phage tail sheath gpL-like
VSGIPVAVSPSELDPGLSMTVNLLAGVSSPGTQLLRGLCIAPRSAAGNLVVDTEIRLIGSPDDAKTAWGPKTPGYLFAVAFFYHNPTGVLCGIAPTASAGANATGTITFTSTPSVSQTVRIPVAGKVTDIPWLAGEDADTIKTRCISYLNAKDDVPCTASSGGTGVLTLTFPVAGPWGNDVQYSVTLLDGTGGGASAAAAAFTGGSTEPDHTTALQSVSGDTYDFLSPQCSNADAQGTGASTNVARLKTHINQYNHGSEPKLQRGVIATTGVYATALAGAIARNEQVFEYLHCTNGQGLPCELAGAEMGQRMADVSIDPAMNRIGTVLPLYVGSADIIADKPTGPERTVALASGVSIVSYNKQREAIVVRPISSHSQDANGNPDRRCFDLSEVDGTYAVANDIEVALPQAFPKAKVSKDLDPGDEPLPEGVVEERDIKAWLVTRLRFWQGRGVVRKDKLDEAIANKTLIVRVNPSDETQVDHVIPLAIFKPLAKFGVVINKI